MIPDVSGFVTASELNSLKSSVSSGKSLVASAVTDKGVSTAADASFQTIANNVNAISTGLGSGVATVMVAGNQSINSGDTVYLGPGSATCEGSNRSPTFGAFNSGFFIISNGSLFVYGWCAGLQQFVSPASTRAPGYSYSNIKSYSDGSFSFDYKTDNGTYTAQYRINQQDGSLESPSSVGSEISAGGSGSISQLLVSSGSGNSISYIGWNGKTSPILNYNQYYSRYYEYALYKVITLGNPDCILLCMPYWYCQFSYIIPFFPDSLGYPCPYYGYKSLDEIPHKIQSSGYDNPSQYFIPYYGVALSSGSPGNKIQVRNYGTMTTRPWG